MSLPREHFLDELATAYTCGLEEQVWITMIDAAPSLQAAAMLSAAALAGYLRSTGWEVLPSGIVGMTIHSKTLPEADEAIRIVLPNVHGLDDERRRVADALRTLEAVEERPIQSIVDEVRRVKKNAANAL